MTVFLLDANVLISIMTEGHGDHDRVLRWATEVERFALCPVVEGAIVRFAVRLGVGAAQVQQALRLVRRRPGFEFWPDALSYGDVNLDRVLGHRQVTDAYLVALAASKPDASLVTLDLALSRTWPEFVTFVPTS